MSGSRLTTLDASFLEVESASAHMHVGWAARFAPPAGRTAPELRASCAITWPAGWAARRATARSSRPCRSSMHDPVWVDDTDFDVDRHVHRSAPARPRPARWTR